MLNSASITRGFNEKQISPSYKTLPRHYNSMLLNESEFVHIEKNMLK